MKKVLLLLIILLITISLFASIFSDDYNKLIVIADKCIENSVYTEELFSVSSGETWAEAAFIPASGLSELNIVSEWSDVLGFLVLKLYKNERVYTSIVPEKIGVSGKTISGFTLSDSWVNVYIMTPDTMADLDTLNGYFATDKDYIILILFEELDASSDYIVSFKTRTSQGVWKVRQNSKEYAEFKNLQ